MARKSRTTAFWLRLAIFAFVAFLLSAFCITYFQQQRSMKEAQARIDALNQQLNDLKLSKAALQSDLDFSKTDAYIERTVREELGYVKKGEIKFVDASSAKDGATENVDG